MTYLIIFLIILIEFLISYFIPVYFGELNYFVPMLTLTFLVYYYKLELNVYLLSAIISIISGLLLGLVVYLFCKKRLKKMK